MPNLVPYINFVNKSEAAIAFYKSVFGGDAEVQKDGDHVVQLEFRAGDIHFMGADHDEGQVGLAQSGNYSLVLNCDSEQQLRDFYAKLVSGGKEIFAPMDSGWGAIVAHCSDTFSVSWMLNYDKPQS